MTEHVYQACLHQALSTEREEILGMLLGRVTADQRAVVWGSVMVPRSDKRPERVEISPEQLITVAERAEEMTSESGQHTRVIGWYHSHPHITPYPSHVDLATQATCQLMEKCWVGLIFSVFNTDSRTQMNRVVLHCFATNVEGSSQHIRVPVRVVPAHVVSDRIVAPFSTATRLPEVLTAEAEESLDGARSRSRGHALFEHLASHCMDEYAFTMTQLLVVESRTAIATATAERRQELEQLRAAVAELERERRCL